MDTAELLALPFVDAHTSVVAAEPDAVWRAVGETVARRFGERRTAVAARLLGCADRAVAGPRPLAEGSTVPGFHVVTAVPGRELALAGRHRFSAYALIFRLEEAGAGRTRVRAETWAAFPGPAGRLYRLLVIGTRGHTVIVRRLLTAIRNRAETPRADRAAGR
ncbi:hypothetical protein J7F01_24115 [Streptomyces sp. ISL-22]|uniref:hypothetical protein n=1 Tax=unclassified Streptomyces TaxID=2593676 RepID=UPI001BEC2A69|nr:MULTISPECIES: hypothetical protein [unclassified Streptomyces]MBT2419835.1 hypothetical protein [Streptomyces sp. ISL-24]MBT2435200.1 hypothetical protein [Streptomyces sp. ISL-22]